MAKKTTKNFVKYCRVDNRDDVTLCYLPKYMEVLGLKNTGLSTAAYPTPSDLFITIVCPAFHTRNTGIPVNNH